jgi:hypothetical protein
LQSRPRWLVNELDPVPIVTGLRLRWWKVSHLSCHLSSQRRRRSANHYRLSRLPMVEGSRMHRLLRRDLGPSRLCSLEEVPLARPGRECRCCLSFARIGIEAIQPVC